MTYDKLEHDMECANFAACRVAFVKMYPNKSAFVSESCEDGEWECSECPWKEKK